MIVIGPWENRRDPSGKFIGNTTQFPPEKNLNAGPEFFAHATGKLKIPLVWREETSAEPILKHPWADAISYAYAAVEAPEDTDCFASLGSDDGYALWVNGKELGRAAAISRSITVDGEKLPAKLKKGRNTILFKLEDTGGGGGLSLRFIDASGAPIQLKVLDIDLTDLPIK